MRLTPQQRLEAILVRIKGIPALANVTRFLRVPGSFRRDAPSDLDFYGYTELEYDIYDRKGYPARWLEQKMDRDATERLEQEIIYQVEGR